MGLAAVGGDSPGLGLCTRAGRLKVVMGKHLAKFKLPELEVMPVEGSDRVVLATGLHGAPERIAVVMKSGRVAAFPADAVPWMSRLGKGTYRLSLARSGKDEPVAMVGLSASQPELVLLAQDGRVRRVDGMALPLRRHEAQGVRVWPTTLASAASGCQGDVVWLVSRQGRLLAFPMSDIRQSKGGKQGVVGMDLHGGDTTVAIGCTQPLGQVTQGKEDA